MTGDCYGFKSPPHRIDIEPVISGNSPVLEEKYRRPHAAVEVVDQDAGNTYVWPSDTARDRAGRVREHAEDGGICSGLASRLEDAADAADEEFEEHQQT